MRGIMKKTPMQEFLARKEKPRQVKKPPEFSEEEKERIQQEARSSSMAPPPEKGMYSVSIDPLDPQNRRREIIRGEMPEGMREEFERAKKLRKKKEGKPR